MLLSEFSHLHDLLQREFPGVSFPNFPRKTLFSLDDSGLQERSKILEQFLVFCVRSPNVSASRILRGFLAPPVAQPSDGSGVERNGDVSPVNASESPPPALSPPPPPEITTPVVTLVPSGPSSSSSTVARSRPISSAFPRPLLKALAGPFESTPDQASAPPSAPRSRFLAPMPGNDSSLPANGSLTVPGQTASSRIRAESFGPLRSSMYVRGGSIRAPKDGSSRKTIVAAFDTPTNKAPDPAAATQNRTASPQNSISQRISMTNELQATEAALQETLAADKAKHGQLHLYVVGCIPSSIRNESPRPLAQPQETPQLQKPLSPVPPIGTLPSKAPSVPSRSSPRQQSFTTQLNGDSSPKEGPRSLSGNLKIGSLQQQLRARNPSLKVSPLVAAAAQAMASSSLPAGSRSSISPTSPSTTANTSTSSLPSAIPSLDETTTLTVALDNGRAHQVRIFDMRGQPVSSALQGFPDCYLLLYEESSITSLDYLTAFTDNLLRSVAESPFKYLLSIPVILAGIKNTTNEKSEVTEDDVMFLSSHLDALTFRVSAPDSRKDFTFIRSCMKDAVKLAVDRRNSLRFTTADTLMHALATSAVPLADHPASSAQVLSQGGNPIITTNATGFSLSLLPSENIFWKGSDVAWLIEGVIQSRGTLLVTNFRVLFVYEAGSSTASSSTPDQEALPTATRPRGRSFGSSGLAHSASATIAPVSSSTHPDPSRIAVTSSAIFEPTPNNPASHATPLSTQPDRPETAPPNKALGGNPSNSSAFHNSPEESKADYRHFWIPLASVSRIDKFGGTASKFFGTPGFGLELISKDGWTYHFELLQYIHDRRQVFSTLTQQCFPLSPDSLFAFSDTRPNEGIPADLIGWKV